MSIDQLFVRHARILRNVEAFEALVGGTYPGQVEGLADRRWGFTRDLLVHFAEMESSIYGPMMRDARPAAQRSAALASAETSALVHDFREHVARWHVFPTTVQWEPYRRAIVQLMQRVRARIDAELIDILPLMPVRPEGSGPNFTAEGYAAEAWKMRGIIYAPGHKPSVEDGEALDEEAA